MRSKWVAMTLLVVVVLMGAAGPAHAEQETGALAARKLFRGVANAATGWMEIFKQTSLTWQESGPGIGLSWGLMKGVGYAIARSVSGAYEIITFPLPIPEGYKPIMEPEYVLSDVQTK